MKNTGSVKIEKRPMWFSDMQGTTDILADNSRDGWHLSELDLVKGIFTYRKGKANDCCYYFQTSDSKENLTVYTDESFQKVIDKNGVVLWKRTEPDPACLDNIQMTFRGDTTGLKEAQWLTEQAAQGRMLLRCTRPEYTFTLCEPQNITYRIVYKEDIENQTSFLAPITSAGWEYVWGNNGYHYFCAPADSETDESVFDIQSTSEGILLRKERAFGAFTAFAVGLFVFAIVITCLNLNKYINLTAAPFPDVQHIARLKHDLLYNFTAVGLSVIFSIVFIVLRQKTRRQRKNK